MGEKWVNVDAGPRQIKDLQSAIGELSREGQSHDELTGVVDGSEHTSSYWSPFGGSRPETAVADEQIKAQFGGKITKKNVREIAAAYLAAVPELRKSRPVQDSRRTAEADAELTAKVAEREAGYAAKRETEQALLSQVLAKAPAGAQALIVAELHEDTSDTQSDYFANKTARTVAIGWRFGKREDFRQLRAAAASFPETAHMASQEALNAWRGHSDSLQPPEGLERRDNYSMGKGNYISDHGWDGAGSGWVVKSRTLPCSYTNLTEDAISGDAPVAAPEAASADGTVTISPGTREGFVEVRFARKPAPEVLAGMKSHGFRWARGSGCWYGRDKAYAESLAACGNCGCPA